VREPRPAELREYTQVIIKEPTGCRRLDACSRRFRAPAHRSRSAFTKCWSACGSLVAAEFAGVESQSAITIPALPELIGDRER